MSPEARKIDQVGQLRPAGGALWVFYILVAQDEAPPEERGDT